MTDQQATQARSKTMTATAHTIADEIVGSLAAMGPLTGEQLVAKVEEQCILAKDGGPATWQICDELNRLLKLGIIEIYDTCDAFDLATGGREAYDKLSSEAGPVSAREQQEAVDQLKANNLKQANELIELRKQIDGLDGQVHRLYDHIEKLSKTTAPE